MDCAACATAIVRSVEKVPGVVSASVDVAGGTARVVSNGKADARAVVAAVAAAGFKAEPAGGGGDAQPRR
ncbi:MAG: heavy-metal-associated domain-containing protein [Elusimicrobia bacterium]|nr:heavy-metal-associated domain-containing protein [Elusimicrobiota bacterium]